MPHRVSIELVIMKSLISYESYTTVYYNSIYHNIWQGNHAMVLYRMNLYELTMNLYRIDLFQSVYCGIYGSTPSDDSNCDAFNKPSQSQPCSIKCPSQCLFTDWSSWSRCAPDNCDNPSNINYKYGFRQRIRQRIEPNIDPDTGTSMFYLNFFSI